MCVKVKVAVLGSPSLIILMVSVDVKRYLKINFWSCVKAEVAVVGYPSIINHKPYGFCGRRAIFEDKEGLRSCVKIEVAVLGSPSIINLTVSVDVKQYLKTEFGAV